ncbi:MAG: apolipoprotein N-acyltransferase [Myxococcota bacterium]
MKLALASILVYTAAFPPFGAAAAAFAAFLPLAFLFLDPARPVSWRGALLAALLFGELTPLAVTGYWIYRAAGDFFDQPPHFGLGFAVFLTALHGALFMAPTLFLARFLVHLGPLARTLAFPTLWVAGELARSRLLDGNPWELLGSAFDAHPMLMRVSRLGGVWLLSWAAVAVSAALATTLLGRHSSARARLSGGSVLGLAVLVLLGGSLERTPRTPAPDRPLPSLRIGLVQPNIGRHELWDPSRRADHLRRTLTLSRSPTLAGVDLLVWPENAVPFLLDADRAARRRIQLLANETGAAVMLGAPRSESTRDGGARFFNSVYLFRPGGTGYETYDKRKLLPYVEVIPEWLVPYRRSSEPVHYGPGRRVTIFVVRGWKIAPLICFESIYPRFAREARRLGADLLVNVSNDSWFDRGAAARQHYGMTVLRAVENAVPLVRVANTGITAVIGPDGAPLARLPRHREAVQRVELAAAPRGRTLYTRWGDWFAWLCVLAAVPSVSLGALRAHRGRAPGG